MKYIVRNSYSTHKRNNNHNDLHQFFFSFTFNIKYSSFHIICHSCNRFIHCWSNVLIFSFWIEYSSFGNVFIFNNINSNTLKIVTSKYIHLTFSQLRATLSWGTIHWYYSLVLFINRPKTLYLSSCCFFKNYIMYRNYFM